MVQIHSTTKTRPIMVGNKVIGTMQGDTFRKSVVGSKHRLQIPPAWAIDADAFDREVRPVAANIVVFDRETETTYRASIDTFVQHCRELDRGFGRQYALPLIFWQTPKSEGVGRQLPLWEQGAAYG